MKFSRIKVTGPRLAALLAAAGASSYATVGRRKLTRWGATEEETLIPLPGDEIVSNPRYSVNHAITINAPAAVVWPWVVQMGQGRGGLYSYDWLENILRMRVHSADRIIPEFQDLKPGDTFRLVPEDYFTDLHFEVVSVEPEHALVMRSPGSPAENLAGHKPFVSWTLALIRLDSRTTRLIARTRSDFGHTFSDLMWNKYGLEPVHFIMERRMLLGIKRRAEASVTTGGGGLGEAVPVCGPARAAA
ncbi:MAG: hypothetical protein M1455_07505 [Actinobacteria bacterium]|nr:hypothetical protein [Actinomycetota bacterium]